MGDFDDLSDINLADGDPAVLGQTAGTDGWLALHGPFTGAHSHAHSTFGAQGGDATHDHQHVHEGDATHDHHDAIRATTSTTEDTMDEPIRAAGGADLVPVVGVLCIEGEQTGDGRFMAEGAISWCDPPLPLAWLVDGDQHTNLIEVAPTVGTIDMIARDGMLIRFAGMLDPGIPEAAEMIRRMAEGSAPFGVRFPLSIDPDDWEVELVDTSPPEPTEEGGSMILLMASGTGPLPTSWRLPARLAAAAGDGDPEGEVVMVDSSDELVARYTRLRIRGATACAVPAFDGAYMELAETVAPAEPTPVETPTETAAETADHGDIHVHINASGMAGTFSSGDAMFVTLPPPAVLRAAGGPERAPAAWFADPRFGLGDGRMFAQPDGHWACPHTVTADGQVFGHMAGWFTPHNALPTPTFAPRSRTDYAAFLRTPMETEEGEIVRVGLLSMGCGHDERNEWTVESVRAHYDGGPGAVQCAAVAVGEDDFGIWYAGALLPNLAEEDVRTFTACGVSGDWREVWRGKGLDLVALLAGVTVPGFTVARGLAAAGWAPMELPASLRLPSAPIVRFSDGRPTVLLSAGVIRQPLPWERAMAAQERRIGALEARLEAAEAVTRVFRADAADRYVEGLLEADSAV